MSKVNLDYKNNYTSYQKDLDIFQKPVTITSDGNSKSKKIKPY